MAINLETIAKKAGTTAATVSKALSDHPSLNDVTKQKIQEISLRCGYCTEAELAARRQKSKRREVERNRKRVLRLQFLAIKQLSAAEMQENTLPYFSVNPATDGIRLELASTAGDTPEALADYLTAMEGEVDGLLLCDRVTPEHLQVLVERDMPAVVLGPLANERMDPIMSCRQTSISMDMVGAGIEATERLLELGHRRVALISAHGVEGLYYDRWCQGYELAHLRAGVPVDRALIDKSEGCDIRVFDLEEPPTAFVCPELNYLSILRNLAHYHGARFDERNVLVGTTAHRIESSPYSDYPALLIRADLLMQASLGRLQELIHGKRRLWETVQLPIHRHCLDKLQGPA